MSAPCSCSLQSPSGPTANTSAPVRQSALEIGRAAGAITAAYRASGRAFQFMSSNFTGGDIFGGNTEPEIEVPSSNIFCQRKIFFGTSETATRGTERSQTTGSIEPTPSSEALRSTASNWSDLSRPRRRVISRSSRGSLSALISRRTEKPLYSGPVIRSQAANQMPRLIAVEPPEPSALADASLKPDFGQRHPTTPLL
jgi:hypothetical protein